MQKTISAMSDTKPFGVGESSFINLRKRENAHRPPERDGLFDWENQKTGTDMLVTGGILVGLLLIGILVASLWQ